MRALRLSDHAGREPDIESGLRWKMVVVAGIVVGVAPYALSVLLINVYATVNHLTDGNLDLLYSYVTGREAAETLGTLLARSGTPVFYLLGALLAAMYVGRRVGSSAVLYGASISLVALLVSNAVTVPFFGWPEPYEWVVYPVVLLGGGVLGGMKGWEIRAGDEAMNRANRAVGAAGSPQAIASALGENLTGSTIVSVGLWNIVRHGSGTVLEPLANWTTGNGRPLSPEMGFGSAADISGSVEPVGLGLGGLRAADRAVWTSRGVRSALLLPLVSHTGTVRALLLVASEKSRGFSSRDTRAYSTVAATASLALENLDLVERANASGRRAGTLEERQRLAHEIHDTLAQGFTSIVTNLEAADSMMDSTGKRSRAGWHLRHARDVARESLAEARRLVWALRPGSLEETPLPEALERLAGKWSSASGVTTGFVLVGEPVPLSSEAEAAILRVAQESLANVEKHAQATRVAMTLSCMPDSVTLDVRDDGAGIAAGVCGPGPAPDGSGFGLRGMEERLSKLGGSLSLESEPGDGTTVSAELPVSAEPVRGGLFAGRNA